MDILEEKLENLNVRYLVKAVGEVRAMKILLDLLHEVYVEINMYNPTDKYSLGISASATVRQVSWHVYEECEEEKESMSNYNGYLYFSEKSSKTLSDVNKENAKKLLNLYRRHKEEVR